MGRDAVNGLSLLLASIALTYGCGGGAGVDLSGPEGPGVMAAYSGDWELVPDESQSLEERMREGMSGGMPRGGMRPSGGGRRGGAGGGARDGAGGMGGQRMDPEEMQRMREQMWSLAAPARELGLSLTETSTTLLADGSPPLVLTLGADPSVAMSGAGEIRATARWTSRGLEVSRAIPNGPEIEDRYTIDDEGLLIVRREIEMMQGRTGFDLRLVYRKAGGGTP
jgi:hypothetical protein